jgi:hypothetical protein
MTRQRKADVMIKRNKQIVIHFEACKTKAATSKIRIVGRSKNEEEDELLLQTIRDLTEKLLEVDYFKGPNKKKKALEMVIKLTKWLFEGKTTKLIAFFNEALKFWRRFRRKD